MSEKTLAPDPADLASLLSTEPWDGRLDSPKDPAHKSALDSAAERIKGLEGVLRDIRCKVAGMSRLMPDEDVQDLVAISSLINEALDPHQPWCRDENHPGACQSDPEDRGGDE